MEEEEYLENIIKDKDIVNKIEETTHVHYKKLFNWVKLMGLYERQLKDPEFNYDLASEIDKDYLPVESVGKIEGNIILNTKIKDLKTQINFEFEELYSFANKYNYYWCNPTLKTYKFYFSSFYSNFKRVTDVNEKFYFLVHEIDHFLDFSKNGFVIHEDNRTNFIHRTGFIDSFSFIDYFPYLFDINKLKVKIQNDKIIEFLLSEVKLEGYSYQLVNNKYTFTKIEGFKRDLNLNIETEEPSIKNYPIGIFKNQTAFELFNYLDDNYVNNFEKAKYTNFYHYFMDRGNILICTQLKYLDFIKKYKDIKISKITPPTPKFKHNTIAEFKEWNKLFELNSKKE